MEGRSSLKQRLTRLFRPSTLLRNSCNSTSSGSIFSSSSATNTSSRSRSRSLSTDTIAHDTVFIRHNTTNKKEESRPRENGEREGEEENRAKNIAKTKKKLFSSNAYGFTSSSEDETETFLSFSSDSSGFYKRPSSRNKKNKNKKQRLESSRRPPRRGRGRRRREEEEEEERSGVPVMKRSTDPYVDFCNSMVEMIVERQIFGAKDLERLILCYLSLNSPSHHSVILRAFADISEVLFGS